MTTKLNRAKQKVRSWQTEYHNLRRMIQAGRHAVLQGCAYCDTDEAEGGVLNHCDGCCRRITTQLYALLVRGELPKPPRQRGRAMEMLRAANARGRERTA